MCPESGAWRRVRWCSINYREQIPRTEIDSRTLAYVTESLASRFAQEKQVPFIPSATRLFSYWDRLRTSFWFLPSTMAGGAILLSFALIQLDGTVGPEWIEALGWLYSFGPEGARAILSAIASSMITVAGLTFSITMLTLQLASSQFGPRLLRNFMRDRGNQIVLGTFIATFVYCLLVLRTVRGTENSSFVPHLSVAFGVLLALASISVLIFFIHHVASAIRIEALLKALAEETREAIERLYPEPLGCDPPNAIPSEHSDSDSRSGSQMIFADATGYVQRIDIDALMQIATEHDLVVVVKSRPGSFVIEYDTIFEIRRSDRLSDKMADQLRGTFIVGQERTPEQDLEFSIRRFVEIAQRALSPGINDPTTALYCIDRLSEAFRLLADRQLPAPVRYDENRHLRIITEVVHFDELACPAFAAIARYGVADADVIKSLLVTLDVLKAARLPSESADLARLIDDIRRESLERLSLEFDRCTIQKAARLSATDGAAAL